MIVPVVTNVGRGLGPSTFDCKPSRDSNLGAPYYPVDILSLAQGLG